MENILLILFWLTMNQSGTFEEMYCETQVRAECGFYQDPRSENPTELISCGECSGHQMCGADFPADNGNFRFGPVGKCGGGCKTTIAFSCDKGVAMVCSRIYDPPQDNCNMIPDENNKNLATNKWCCPTNLN